MKLAKTILACVAALALVCTMAVSALADSKTATYAVSTNFAECTVGDTITVTVVASADDDKLASGKAPLTYDSAKLEVVSVSAANENVEAEAVNAGTVNAGFMFQDSIAASSTTLYTVTFKAIAEGTANLSIGSNYAIDDDDDVYVVVVSAASVVINAEEEDTKAEEPDTKAEEPDTTKAAEADDTTKAADADDTTAVVPTSKVVPSEQGTEAQKDTPKTGSDASMAIAAGLVVLAGAAYVATKKSK